MTNAKRSPLQLMQSTKKILLMDLDLLLSHIWRTQNAHLQLMQSTKNFSWWIWTYCSHTYDERKTLTSSSCNQQKIPLDGFGPTTI